MRIFFAILILLTFSGCRDFFIYKPSEIKGWHKIDFSHFELSTPKKYKYIRREGIDSFVGEITDGEVRIIFDYGCYTSEGPADKTGELNKFKNHISGFQHVYLFDLLDVSPYTENGSTNLTELYNDFTEINLRNYSDSIELSIPIEVPPEYFHEFRFKGELYRVPFYFSEYVIANEKRFESRRDTVNNIIRKSFNDRFLSDTMELGVYLVDRNEFDESINSYCKAIGMFAHDVSTGKLEEVKSIFQTVRLK